MPLERMTRLTGRQKQILEYIRLEQSTTGSSPSLREIARHFGFVSMNAALAHVRALRRKGFIKSHPHRARSLQLVSPVRSDDSAIVEIPVYGTVPAGTAEDRKQEAAGTFRVSSHILGGRGANRLFALVVKGESMIGKNILDGDWVILDPDRPAREGDVVAALIDNESTLKTFAMQHGRPILRAENPRFSELIPAQEMVIQGVMVAMVRPHRTSTLGPLAIPHPANEDPRPRA